MKICHIQGIFSPEHGGPTRSLTNYCSHQIAAGHQVSAWVLEGFPNMSAAVRLKPPVEMHVCRVDAPARLGGSAEMRQQLRAAESPDVYHLHGAWLRALSYGAVEAKRRQRPYVLELMGMYEPWALCQKRLQKQIARWWYQDRILRNAACLHVNSQQEADYLRALGFKRPAAVIPVGVDLENIERLKAENTDGGTNSTPLPGRGGEGVKNGKHNEFYSQLNGHPFVLFLSRLHPKKGLDLLIRSWAQVRKINSTPHPGPLPERGGEGAETGKRKTEDWMLVIAGTGAQEYVNECRQLAEQLGIANQCLWLGHVDELQKSWLFTHAHCYVLPTSSENFGNTIAEALAHGTPVITTHHTPWTDLTKHHCGWLIDNTETELSRSLMEAMQVSTATRLEMGRNGIELIKQRYSLDLACKNLLALYKWLLGKGPKPECVQTIKDEQR